MRALDCLEGPLSRSFQAAACLGDLCLDLTGVKRHRAQSHSDMAFQVASYTVVIWYNAPLANGKKRVPGH